MRRRRLLTHAAASLALPAVARAAAQSTIRFIPEADLAVLDPIWTTASQSSQHAFLVYDTLFGQDAAFRPQPQMLEGYVVENDGRDWNLTLRDDLAFHDGAKVLARDAAASIRRWGQRDTFGQTLMQAADEVSATDDRTILLRMKYAFPVAEALSKTGANVCVVMPERLAGVDAFTQVTDPTGSGPFRFKADERIPGARVVYERNPAYVPRASGAPSNTAGPKIVHFDRVEWTINQDPTTQANALHKGEVDWLLTPNADLVDSLRQDRNITVRVIAPTGSISIMRFNQMQKPFDNPAIRRAFFPAINQSDYMIAMNGTDRTRWRDGVGYFCPGTPMASAAGLEVLTSPRSIDAAKRALAEAGYAGEKVVLLGPADVTADLYKQLGLNLDYQLMDWGTLVQRRAKQDPLDKGGWSVFQTNSLGPGMTNPAEHIFLRGNGKQAAPGWPVSPGIEDLRGQWLRTADLDARRKLAERIQLQAFQDVPYIPLGQMITPTAYRADLVGMVEGAPVFWNIRRG